MDLPVREVLRPESLDRALELLQDSPPPTPVCGGTDLLVQLRARRREAAILMDISHLPLSGIRRQGDSLVIGATTTMEAISESEVVRSAAPALATAAGQVGAWPIQCRATLGGNLANASPAADTAPPLVTAGAELAIASAWGLRTVPVQDFFLAPGQTVLESGELIVEVRVPALDTGPGVRRWERFVKLGPRREQIISVVSLALRTIVAPDGRLRDCRIALGSVGPKPLRARFAERALEGHRPEKKVRHEAVLALQSDISPIDDVRAPERYRRIASAVLLDRVLEELAHG